jgi:thaumatin family protein
VKVATKLRFVYDAAWSRRNLHLDHLFTYLCLITLPIPIPWHFMHSSSESISYSSHLSTGFGRIIMASSSRKRTYANAFGTGRIICAAAAVACTVQSVVSESIPPAHMRQDLSKLLHRRDGSTGSIPITVINSCTEEICPGINTQHGDNPSLTGFCLQPGENQTITVSNNWQGRIWPRTNCTFPNPNAPSQACRTGDCAGALNCTVSVGRSN